MKKLVCVLGAGSLFVGSPGLYAADGTKANNVTDLSATGSWVGGSAPDAAGIAIFDSTLTVSRNAKLGNDLSWAGIRMTNPTADTTFTIGDTADSTLTLGSAGIDMSDSTGNLTINAQLHLGAAQTWSIGAGRILEIGSTRRTISGSSDLTITGPGTLRMPGTSKYTYTFGTGTLRLGGGVTLSQGGNGRTISNATVLEGDIGLEVFTPDTYSSPFIFAGGLDVGSGYRTITFSRAGNKDEPGAINNQTLQFNMANAVTGSGTLALANASSDTDKAATVMVASGGSLSVANLVIGDNVWVGFNSGADGDIGIDTALTVEAGGYFALVAPGQAQAGTRNIKSLSGAGTVTNRATNNRTSTLVINGGSGSGRTDFSGKIDDIVTGKLALTKDGSTTQVLSGDSTYLGATAVNGGVLLINGTHIQAANGDGYSVASGANLGGSGRIARMGTSGDAVKVLAGGSLAPGDGIGTLTLDGGNQSGSGAVLNMAVGAGFDFQLAGDGSGSDKVAFWNYASGDLLLNTNEINLTLAGPKVAGTYTVTLFEFYADSGTSLSINTGITSGLTIGSYDEEHFDGTPTLQYNNALGTVTLTYTVIPEPTSVLLWAGGCAALVLNWRRRPYC